MEKYRAELVQKGVEKVYDSNPQKSYQDQVCTVYIRFTALPAMSIANSLNMAHELKRLSPKATKKQMLEIINKYR